MCTTTEAAAYLAERGYTVGRRRVGGAGAPTADTIRHWCGDGKFPGAKKRGRDWSIPQEDLDRLIRSKTMKELTIHVDTTDEAMVSGPGWEGYDPQASVSAFLDQVLTEAQRAYPGVHITITSGSRNRAEADELAHTSNLDEEVRDLVNRVWDRQEWYVK